MAKKAKVLLFAVTAMIIGAASLFASSELSVQSYADLVRFAGTGIISVEVYTLGGKPVWSKSGTGALDWTASGAANGVYFYKLTSADKEKFGKLAIVRGRGALAPVFHPSASVGKIAIPEHDGSWDTDHCGGSCASTESYNIQAYRFGFNVISPSFVMDIKPVHATSDGFRISAYNNTVSSQIVLDTANSAGSGTGHADLQFRDGNTLGFRFLAAFGNVSTARYGGFIAYHDRDGIKQNLRFFNEDANGNIQTTLLMEAGQVAGTGGFVGINTTDPTARFEVVEAAGAQARLKFNSTYYSDLTTTSAGYLAIEPSHDRVGVNTATPATALDVLSTANPQVRVSYDGSNYLSLGVASNGYGTLTPSGGRTEIVGDLKLKNAGNRIIFYDGSTMETAYVGSANAVSNAGDAIITGDSDANAIGDIIFKTASTNKGIVKNNGNFGIGTTTPDDLLDVEGVARLTNSTGNVQLSSTSLGYLYILPSGNRVGIGTNAPTRMLDVKYAGATPQFRLGYDASQYADFRVDSTGDLGITTGGWSELQVGIGTESPTAALEIEASSPEIILDGTTAGQVSLLLNANSDFEIDASGNDVRLKDMLTVTGIDDVAGTDNTVFESQNGTDLVVIANGETSSAPIMEIGAAISGSPSATVTIGSTGANSALYLKGGTTQQAMQVYGHSSDYVGYFKQNGTGNVMRLECTGFSTNCDYFISAYDVSTADTKFKVARNGEVFADGAYYCALSSESACIEVGTGADIAERISTTEALEPGDVVVIDVTIKEQFKKSDKAYDKLVVGVVSTAPAIVIGNAFKGDVIEADEDSIEALKDDRPALALAGRVPVKVTGIVNAGDLLTTSDVPGHAMACIDYTLCAGAIIGKALESSAGDGTIIALVSLQ